MITIGKMQTTIDSYIIANPAIFVDDGIFNETSFTDSQFGKSVSFWIVHFIQCFKKVGPHDIAANYGSSIANSCTYA